MGGERRGRLLPGIGLALACLLGLALPARAQLPPEALRQRARASRAMPESLRGQAAEVARSLSPSAEPEELTARLFVRFGPEVALPTALYAAVEHAEMRERLVDEFARRIHVLEDSDEIFHDYLQEVNEFLRVAPSGPAGPPLPELDDFPPRIEKTPEKIHVLRDLPRPTPATPAARLRLFREAALADLDRVEATLERARAAQETYQEQQVRWMRHLVRLSEIADELSDRELLLSVRKASD
ncbi:MAG: hypothetical protein HY319_02775 [Armatimonadetes bacterium]|nr:hypothetical protein [Armatimonadota bacterium]